MLFALRDRLVGDYASYTRSFIKITDPRIRRKVDTALDAGAFGPEPLLQLNPALKPGGTIDDPVAEGILHEECARAFRPDRTDTDPAAKQLPLYAHQAEAIRLALVGGDKGVFTQIILDNNSIYDEVMISFMGEIHGGTRCN